MSPKKATKDIISQITGLLHNVDQSIYTMPIELIHLATIGQHIRHILEFYQCLIRGAAYGSINYDLRESNTNFEKNISYTISTFESLETSIELLNLEKEVNVTSNFIGHTGDLLIPIQSTIGRELLYAFDHAIHHLAIIKIVIKTQFPEVKVPFELGISPSTLKAKPMITK